MLPTKQPKTFQILSIALEIWDFIEDRLPDFEQRMINKEFRYRTRHAKGKMSDEELGLKLERIRRKRSARGSR